MATVDPREIGRRIKRAREKKTLTQLAFALEANVSPSTVARWEAGKLPPIRELMRIAELLDVEPDELVELDEVTPTDAEALRLEIQAMREERAQVAELLAENRKALEKDRALLQSLLEELRRAASI